jgi:hypothetical protein
LEYVPLLAEDIIWDAIIYLMGVDQKYRPDSYQDSDEDIRFYWGEWQG